jgi:serine/threonine protein kinase
MLVPETIFYERYRIERFLAQGGGGAVYEAYDTKNKRAVALKELIHSDLFSKKAFDREAKRLHALHHPAFPEVYEWFEVKGNRFLVMEYIPDNNLRTELNENGAPFPLEKVMNWAYILLDALDYLHTRDPVQPIIHRDIKPENLKLNKTNLIRRTPIILLDFGLSKGAAEDISQSGAGVSIVGYTRGYAAPEQQFKGHGSASKLSAYPENLCRFGTRPTDARSDLYSLGATLYTLLTNTLPPDAEKRAALLWNNLGDPLLPIHEINPQVPLRISDIIHRAMSFEPEARYASAIEMLVALCGAPDDLTPAQPSPLPPPYWTPSQLATTVAGEPDALEFCPTQRLAVPVKYGLLGTCDSAVRAVAFSPESTHLVTGSNDATVRLWDVATGEMIILGYCEPGENGLAYVSSVSFAPDGSIASVSNDRMIRLWRTSAAGDDNVRVLAVCRRAPRSVAFSSNGKHLATGESDGAVHLWDVASGEPMLLGHCAGAVGSIVFTPDGAYVLAESDDGTIRVWHHQGRGVSALKTFDKDTRSIAVSPDGKLIVAACGDHRLRIADFGAPSMSDLAVFEGGMRSIAFSPDNSRIAIGGEDKLVSILDIKTGARHVLGECTDVVSSVAFSADGRTIASGSWDKSVRLWDVTRQI